MRTDVRGRRAPQAGSLGVAAVVCGMLAALVHPAGAVADRTLVGVNEVPGVLASTDIQNTLIAELRQNGVTLIRTGLSPGGDPTHTVAQSAEIGARISAAGVQILLLLFTHSPLSASDPDQSAAYFRALLDALDARGVRLAGIELGNEINGAAWNADFASFSSKTAAEHRLLGPHDLASTPEGQKVSAGLLRYLDVLAALKDARDHSRVNTHTPTVSGGLAIWELPDDGSYPTKTLGYDIVSAGAALTLLRAHGLDRLVDGYGLHLYPWNGDNRMDERFAQYEAPLCGVSRPGVSPVAPLIAGGKPCWLTEWGFPTALTCSATGQPADDPKRDALIEQFRNDDLRPLAQQGRLAGITYYDWGDDWSGPSTSPYSLFRCNGLTRSGQLAIAPL